MAKEQGLRSRAAFKLTQINRKFPCLESSETAVLDLCAAPGGWTQVAARTCPKSTHIVAVDILPIRSFKGFPNITTLIGDITTDKCKAEIRQAIAQGQRERGNSSTGKASLVDLVLHDGAPNVGAEFGKDAYEQNEIALHALKCATQHLRLGGTFVTKIYRSRDYASYHWLLQQLFDQVDVFKPKASRQQSAEIFLVARQYKAPAKIDARLLDPKHIFEAVEGNTTGGGNADATHTGVSIFHKNFDKRKRQRSGYDMEFLDGTMRHITSVKDFVEAGFKEAVQILGQSTGMEFDANCPHSNFLRHHPLTTSEIQTNVSDLKVLNKADFRALLQWRVKMQEAWVARKEMEEKEDDDEDDDNDEASSPDSDKELDSDAEEEEIQNEISEMRQRRLREKKKLKKKERAQAAKRRRQAALGMDLNAIDIPDNDKLFSLTSITSKGDLAAAAEVNLDKVTDDQVFGDSDEDVVVGQAEEEGVPDDERERHRRRERDLDEAYEMYLQSTKNAVAKSGTKLQKRSKKIQRQKVIEEAIEDQEMMLSNKSGIMQDTMAYAKLLQGPKDDDDSDDKEDGDSDDDDESDDDGFHAEPVTAEVHAELKRQRKQASASNPLIQKFELDEPSSAKTARWFSNPLFESIQKAAHAASTESNNDGNEDDEDSDNEGDIDDGSSSQHEEEEEDSPKKQAVKSKAKHGDDKPGTGQMTAHDVMALMPMTDKQKRHVKRLKQMALDERKQARRAKKMGEEAQDFEVAPGAKQGDDDEADLNDNDEQLKHMSESKRRKVLEAREQIKAGMGKALTEASPNDDKKSNKQNSSFEVVGTNVSTGGVLPVRDDRKYDSEHEDYDSDDYAETLAIGTMLLRKSKEKSFLDASYNRFAWNDPSDLPDWFVDDEKKHYRPQLPIPPALMAKMKEQMMALATKPIQKVAEARARKHKRAKAKLETAKKKAEAVAKNNDMSDAMKLKAISKALRGQESKSKPGKTYVVAKKGGRGATVGNKSNGGKGVQLVDKRMKSDKRATDRIDKKRKKGKQNGLTGSKKRRHHK